MSDDELSTDIPAQSSPNSVPIQVTKPSGFSIAGSPWSAFIVFRMMAPEVRTDTNTIALTEKPGFVTEIPWSLAKAMHEALGNAITKFEQEFGVVSVPKDALTANTPDSHLACRSVSATEGEKRGA
jgi:hypothetical protein